MIALVVGVAAHAAGCPVPVSAGPAALRKAAEAALAADELVAAADCAANAVAIAPSLAPSHCAAGAVALARARGADRQLAAAAAASFGRCAALYERDLTVLTDFDSTAPGRHTVHLAGGARQGTADDIVRWTASTQQAAAGAWQQLAVAVGSAGAVASTEACGAAAETAGRTSATNSTNAAVLTHACVADAFIVSARLSDNRTAAADANAAAGIALLDAAARAVGDEEAREYRREAVRALKKAFKLGNAAAAAHIASAASDSNAPDAAESWLRKGVAAAPGDGGALASLARFLADQSRCEDALSAVSGALDSTEPHPTWLTVRADCKLRLEGPAAGVSAYAEGVRLLEKAGKKGLHAADLAATGGAEALKVGQWSAADALLRRALATPEWECGHPAAADPQCGPATHNLAMAEHRSGNAEAAAERYAAASRLLGSSNKPLFALAHLNRQRARWDAAHRTEVSVRRRLQAQLAGSPAAWSDRWGSLQVAEADGDIPTQQMLAQPGLSASLILRTLRARAGDILRGSLPAKATDDLQRAYQRALREDAWDRPVGALVSADLHGGHPVGRALRGLLAGGGDDSVRWLCIHAELQPSADAVTDELKRGCSAGFTAVPASPVPPHGAGVLRVLSSLPAPPLLVVDLSGDTLGGQSHVFAADKGPLPVQAGYLGFPASAANPTASSHAFVDAAAAPPRSSLEWTERLVYLTPAYLSAPAAAEEGTVSAARSMCALTALYKVGPEIFGVWTAALSRVPGSSLQIVEFDGVASAALEALRREAAARGVISSRIIGLPRLPSETHAAARAKACSFVVDAPLYNGHSTTLEALSAGIPVVAQDSPGASFRSRAAASMVRAAGTARCV
eukprot:TRINITY_DN5583_c0_g1_i5.p1 TRINITY_DN5583_c0_g1~~TRINITY_DN5583_c0_g1_i5.p1  ORF type:complete len:857 (+),score=131.57 TRINITY_DN5583_c0_g1_i5:51-2621(+)